MEESDYIIIGGGFFGLYAAKILSDLGAKPLVLERESSAFQRASLVNQARVHNGYHYPRSLATAQKTKKYYDRFHKDFNFCINANFKKIYAISKNFSLTDSGQFEKFCNAAGIPWEEIKVENYFQKKEISHAYITEETSFDANKLATFLIDELNERKVPVYFSEEVVSVEIENDKTYCLTTKSGKKFSSSRVLNATYAGLNQINHIFSQDFDKLKYELCEVILVKPSNKIKQVGLTIMDGPFLSLMPFGLTHYHSLTSVTHTPVKTSSSSFPEFSCQTKEVNCAKLSLNNCNFCSHQPESGFTYMNQMAKKYLSEEVEYEYAKSLFTVKTVLLASEMDDSRPTLIREKNTKPLFRTVLSGKINTIFDLEEVLKNDLQS